jgi:hypothetical protein
MLAHIAEGMKFQTDESAQRRDRSLVMKIQHKFSETNIAKSFGEKICQRLVRKSIRQLQQMDSPGGLLSGDDSGLTNTWDEICVQQQLETSFYWEAYIETIRSTVHYHVETLSDLERDAAWLQTDEYDEWDCEYQEDREPNPVFGMDIENLIVERLLEAANNWGNERIRNYLNRRVE